MRQSTRFHSQRSVRIPVALRYVRNRKKESITLLCIHHCEFLDSSIISFEARLSIIRMFFQVRVGRKVRRTTMFLNQLEIILY